MIRVLGKRMLSTAAAPSTLSPVGVYAKLVQDGIVNHDAHQAKIVESLESLHHQMCKYEPPEIDEPSAAPVASATNIFQRLFGAAPEKKTPEPGQRAPKGLYMHGDVGCGKTMLMDMFFDTVPFAPKRRVHFHEFMQDFHQRKHAFEQDVRRRFPLAEKVDSAVYDAIPSVARQLAREARLLCFDEFQVVDIVDAMILRRLFGCLFDHGVVVVATSNRPPHQLYQDGLQRLSFVPFIPLLQSHCAVLPLQSGVDYRRLSKLPARSLFLSPIHSLTNIELDSIFETLSAHERNSSNQEELTEHKTIKVYGRTVTVPISFGRIARFTFKQLCETPMSAADYVELNRHFDTFFVSDIPQMSQSKKNEARRFINFVDATYNNSNRLVCSAEVEINRLFVNAPLDTSVQSDAQRMLLDDLKLGDSDVSRPIFTGAEEVFAFERAVSRLIEMQSDAYWNLKQK